jgi:hypothetical protein
MREWPRPDVRHALAFASAAYQNGRGDFIFGQGVTKPDQEQAWYFLSQRQRASVNATHLAFKRTAWQPTHPKPVVVVAIVGIVVVVTVGTAGVAMIIVPTAPALHGWACPYVQPAQAPGLLLA